LLRYQGSGLEFGDGAGGGLGVPAQVSKFGIAGGEVDELPDRFGGVLGDQQAQQFSVQIAGSVSEEAALELVVPEAGDTDVVGNPGV
jgi:hypothetical protein